MYDLKITISRGNAKTGLIPSVSLPCFTTCRPDAPCRAKCYANKFTRRRPNVATAYEKNYSAYINAPETYFLQIRAAAALNRFFRYHVAGDIPDACYFDRMVRTAEECPETMFLAFTKRFEIVNNYIDCCGSLPENLKIVFSNWGAWKCKNPHGLPVAEVIFKNEAPAEDWKICGGNCTECACRGVGCWELKNGETIAFYEH